MAIVLALLASLSYGISDFVGGLLSRRTSAWAVATVTSLSSGLTCVVLALAREGDPVAADFAWAALAGVGGGIGIGFLYRGFSTGRIGVVAPVSAVGSALVPVVFGVVGGERPGLLVWAGIVVAFPAIWLVSSAPSAPSPGSSGDAGLTDGVLAGIGFGLIFASLGQVPAGSGLWPLAVCNLLSAPVVVLVATRLRGDWVPRDRVVWWALAAGPFGAGATLLFLLASQRGLLTVSSVLTALYPASTVALAVLVLHEHVHRLQAVGLLLCAVTVALVAGG